VNRVFEWLFKYPPVVFERGEFSLAALSSTSTWVALGAVAIGGAYMIARRRRQTLSRRVNIVLLGLRLGALALLVFCLLQPVVIVPSVIPHRAIVALLVDDSLSMTIRDVDGRSRWDVVQTLLVPESPFLRRLASKFRVRLFSLGGEERASRAEARRTDLAAGLERVLESLRGEPVAALLLLSDGAHNVKRDLSTVLPHYVARRVPIYTIGVGAEHMESDIEVVRANVPRWVLKGSSVQADLLLRCGRKLNRRVTIRVLEDERVLQVTEIECAGGREPQAVFLDVMPSGSGIHRYTFLVDPQPGELILENNRLDAIVNVRDEAARVLYIEGEPRWEYGKIRAAVAEDEQLHLVSVVRTARGKFYRQGVESGEELVKGFPEHPEELFRFQGLILGSVEAGFFTREHLEWMEAFVSRRGGGLLMLGGPRAFSAGGYALTPVADVLPVELRRPSDAPREDGGEGAPDVAAYAPRLTDAGREHPLTRLRADRTANERAWRALPRITIPELFTRAKPGALVLLEGVKASRENVRPILLAVHRYGRGLGLAFTASDSWRWQMEMNAADLSHETFWRQMLRYLVSFADDPVSFRTETDAYEVGDEALLRIEVRDELFRPLADAVVEVDIRTPQGAIERLRASPSSENEGEYVGRLSVREPGLYRLRAYARRGDRTLGEAETSLIATVPDREYRQAEHNVELLTWLARETGGRYFPISEAAALLPELEYSASEYSVPVTKELWDMPIVFLLLVGLLSLEWALRRRHGLI